MKKIKNIIGLLTITLLLSITFTAIGSNMKNDLANNLDFESCEINNSSCNVLSTNLDYSEKLKLDNYLSNFYLTTFNKYDKNPDNNIKIYNEMLLGLKSKLQKGNYYEKTTYYNHYLYTNIETEILKMQNYKNIKNTMLNELSNSSNNSLNNQNNQVIYSEKNTKIKSFTSAKNILEKNIYNGKTLPRTTSYCSCDYNSKKQVDNTKCGFKNNGLHEKRSTSVEWEHVVPAENFGRSFSEWRDGHTKCKDSKGNSYKGRECVSKVNSEFKLMESDLYNLIPAIGSINAQRSNYQVSEIQGEKYVFGKCDVEIDTENNTFEPPQNLKGDIARIYKYMDTTYSGRGIIGEQTKRIFEVWEKIDPISVEECNRYKAILKYQKNKNIVLHETCSKLN